MPSEPNPISSPNNPGSASGTRPAAADRFESSGRVIQSLRELAGRTVVWRQPSQLRRDYELVAQQDVVATLRWRKNFGTTAIAHAPEGTWSFKASGFLNPRVSVRLPTSEFDLAVFRPRATGEGILESMGERRFAWRCVNFWNNAWAFFTEESDRLLLFKSDGVYPKITGIVEVDPRASSYQEIGYLAAFGWYLLLLMAEETGSSRTP